MRRLTNSPRGRRPGRRGATLPLVCILLTVLVGGAALAIDLGRLYLVGTEAQAAADASALAAGRFLQQYQPYWPYVGSYGAYTLAGANRVANQPGAVQSSDLVAVAYDPASNTVTPSSWSSTTSAVQVTVRATPKYMFAGALGLTPPSVARTATAWVAFVNGMSCVRPIGLPYTRVYESGEAGIDQDSTWTRQHLTAPDFNMSDMASLQPAFPWYNAPPQRTWVSIPAWQAETTWHYNRAAGTSGDGVTRAVTGRWMPGDFTGGGINAYTTYTGAPPKSASCQAAAAQVGATLNPLVYQDTTALLAATAAGMGQLCNRYGNNTDAHCYDSTGAVGVRARMMLVDSVAAQPGPYVFRVREVAVMRIMCYFRSIKDVCAPAPITDEYGTTSTWQMTMARSNGKLYSTPTSGYAAGTIAYMLDGPNGTDPTSDLVYGNKPSMTQRLMLVKSQGTGQ